MPLIAYAMLVACGADDGSSGGQSTPATAQPPPDTNSPPVISGTPPTGATLGQPWSFEPRISDPDGDRLTVTGENIPPWIMLSAATGRMSGTPQAGDILTWSDIRLTVSDGRATATLPQFAIAVVQGDSNIGTAALSWTPPTERVDGSPIGELAGYEVLYGQASRNYDHLVELDAGVTRYVVENLGPGTWYFAIRAITTDGLESGLSAEASKRI